ncbi:MAG: hypothetical protein JWN84_1495 [Nocardioides sp.]|nr:hypothetical protein [Nocardioides sp.]
MPARRLLLLPLLATAGAAAVAARRRLEPVAPALRKRAILVPTSLRGPVTLRLARLGYGAATPAHPGVEVTEERAVVDGASVPVVVHRPRSRTGVTGAFLWIHGGGTVMGTAAQDTARCSETAHRTGALVVSVDYRLAPEHPFPAGLDDCATALRWLHREAASLGVDPARIVVGGASAGGLLAASLAQRARDEDEVTVAGQVLVYPMLDDRTAVRTDHAGTGAFVWTPTSNAYAWSAYLGHPAGGPEDRPYAVPARATDLAGLPPAHVVVGSLDLFLAEDLDYAERLRAAGVPCEVHVEPGMWHAADVLMAGDTPEMVALRARVDDAVAAFTAPPS